MEYRRLAIVQLPSRHQASDKSRRVCGAVTNHPTLVDLLLQAYDEFTRQRALLKESILQAAARHTQKRLDDHTHPLRMMSHVNAQGQGMNAVPEVAIADAKHIGTTKIVEDNVFWVTITDRYVSCKVTQGIGEHLSTVAKTMNRGCVTYRLRSYKMIMSTLRTILLTLDTGILGRVTAA